MCVGGCLCVCVWVGVCGCIHIRIHTHTHTHISRTAVSQLVCVRGLAGSCARACDAASACTAFSHRDGSGVCTLYGPTSSRSEPADASRAVRESPHACERVRTCGRGRIVASHRSLRPTAIPASSACASATMQRCALSDPSHARAHSFSHLHGTRSAAHHTRAHDSTAQAAPLGDRRTRPRTASSLTH